MSTDFTPFINELVAKTGLNLDVVRLWVLREQGRGGSNTSNPLGANAPHQYPSQVAAADATATLLQTSANYAGIRATYGGTSAEQAMAISQSPWRLGPTGLKQAGGTDKWYLAGFQSILGNVATPSGGVSTPIVPTNQDSTSTFDINNPGASVPSKPLFDLLTPIRFLGVVLIGLTIFAVGGIITLKGKALA